MQEKLAKCVKKQRDSREKRGHVPGRPSMRRRNKIILKFFDLFL